MNKIILIAACDDKNGIGIDNTLPWKNKTDMQYFKETTSDHIVVMGRNTYESIPKKFRPLDNRLNVVLTKDEEFYKSNPGITTMGSIEHALEFIKSIFNIAELKDKNVYIIGGSSIYEQFLPYCNEAIITKIKGDYNCNKFLPIINGELISSKELDENTIVNKYFLGF